MFHFEKHFYCLILHYLINIIKSVGFVVTKSIYEVLQLFNRKTKMKNKCGNLKAGKSA